VTIQVLSEKHVPARAIARQLGVTDGAVRYHLRRARDGAIDGRKAKVFDAAAFEGAIDVWRAEHVDDDRPINAREVYEHPVRTHGYRSSYKSVLRYLRARFGRPRIRAYRRVETPPGAHAAAAARRGRDRPPAHRARGGRDDARGVVTGAGSGDRPGVGATPAR